ncbi:MAG: cyclic nucleotide-binding domain-containing protein [Alphaproteobacteria bacterium]|nr:MAG: cyclic nucleotide-binding domain-containing protein [Alphaproteobacteria bacterium]
MKSQVSEHGLDGVEIFRDLEDAERARLAAELETLNLKRGDVLVRQGEMADALYVVVTGRFSVTVAGRRQMIAELGPGQPVGEIAFLAGGVRTATVTALRDSLVLRLGRAEFEELSSKNPSIWHTLTVTLARRVADTNITRAPPPDPRPRTITLIRAGSSELPAGFIVGLTRVFRRSNHTMLVWPEMARTVLPASVPIDSTEATRALNALEAKYDYVLFVAEPELTPWSEKAIRQADLVLAIGMHAANEQPNALERLAAELLPPDAQRLVLLHDTHGPIAGTARWLAHRNIAMHHHVALDNVGDAERLYRFINGTALGLIACGGGAYCAAHIGLYKALVQSSLTFDIMGGTSGGAAMTAGFAMGAHPDEVDRATHDIFVTNRAMRRYTWPRYSLLDHTNYDRQLAKYYSGVDIEDLWIPYFCVSTNLSSYDLHRHRQGDLWAAVRASGSVPVLLPPYYTKDGHMLVDGALLDNVPVRVMHELKSGPNVVISFEVPKLQRFEVDYRSLPGRAALLKAMINPFMRGALPRAPSVGTVLMRSMMANRQDFERRLRPEDLLLVPPCPQDMGILDWHRHTELADSTYHWGLREIARLKAADGHPALGASPGSNQPPASTIDAAP